MQEESSSFAKINDSLGRAHVSAAPTPAEEDVEASITSQSASTTKPKEDQKKSKVKQGSHDLSVEEVCYWSKSSAFASIDQAEEWELSSQLAQLEKEWRDTPPVGMNGSALSAAEIYRVLLWKNTSALQATRPDSDAFAELEAQWADFTIRQGLFASLEDDQVLHKEEYAEKSATAVLAKQSRLSFTSDDIDREDFFAESPSLAGS